MKSEDEKNGPESLKKDSVRSFGDLRQALCSRGLAAAEEARMHQGAGRFSFFCSSRLQTQTGADGSNPGRHRQLRERRSKNMKVPQWGMKYKTTIA